MKTRFTLWGLSSLLVVLGTGCDLFNPQSSKGTIEISNTYTTSNACLISVNLDGGNTTTVANGSVYTFPLTSPGSHTVNFSMGGGCSGPPCTISPTSVTFQVNARDLYVLKVSQGNACQNLVVTGP
jgi:hypothetical protein